MQKTQFLALSDKICRGSKVADFPERERGGNPPNYDTFLAKQLSIREIGALGGKNPTNSFEGFPNRLAGYSTTGALVVILLHFPIAF